MRPLTDLRAAVPGLEARPVIAARDGEGVTGVLRACEIAVTGDAEVEQHEVEEYWARPGIDLERDTVVVLDAGVPVAYAEVYRGERAEGYVAPGHRGRGIGSALVEWWIGRAAEVGSDRVGQTIEDGDASARALLESFGCRPVHTAWIVRRELGPALPPVPELPAGYALRAMQPDEGPALHAVIEDAFSEWEGRRPGQYGDWAATAVASPRWEPWMGQVVTAGDQLVGAAVLRTLADEGWIDQIAVAAAHRGRGLGRALLERAFGLFHGVRPAVGLATDSRTGALDLYLHVGMQVRRSFTRWSLDLPG
jgi:GNAT superfamily N-acetyltransferase